ncbi:MAG: hypothetical protein U0271_45430 [Polyangiaceae bacterium]
MTNKTLRTATSTGLFLSWAVVAACSGGAESKSNHSGDSGETSVRENPDSTLEFKGHWRDATGEAPWEFVVIEPRDARSGHLRGLTTRCATPPCDPVEAGDYALAGRELTAHTPKLEGKHFVVHLAGDVMEWRQDDITVYRFHREAEPRPDPPPREHYPAKDAARPAGTPCEELTAQGCLWSTDCVLVAPDKNSAEYVCRKATGACEGGIAQSDPGFERDCQARGSGSQRGGGCAFSPGSCYCPNARTKVKPRAGSGEALLASVACACGGGEYRRCVPSR